MKSSLLRWEPLYHGAAEMGFIIYFASLRRNGNEHLLFLKDAAGVAVDIYYFRKAPQELQRTLIILEGHRRNCNGL